ncbi:MAG: tetratricopeptide repeat protein [Candidatus Dormibacteria bacterium]
MTFVFTDIEGSTMLLEHLGVGAYSDLLHQHHVILRRVAISGHGGTEVRTVGDSFFLAFRDAGDAVAAMLQAQLALEAESWPQGARVKVRMGMHTGAGQLGGDDYVGRAVHQAARICSASHGGQLIATAASREAAGSPPDGAVWVPMGRHRLKDLSGAVELYELSHPGLPQGHPPLRTLDRISHNLPVQLSSFLGRSAEIAEAADILKRSRLVTMTGPGGTGKTRLAYQVAAECLEQFPDGVWVAELASLSDPARVPDALLSALGLRDQPASTALQTLLSHLRERKALVVLDNCEHLVDAVAEVADTLLRGSRLLQVLATSRQALRLGGETVWPVAPLALPNLADGALETVASADSVALFCERAAEARPGFALVANNADLVARICARMEGLPLGIELAAARVRTLPLGDIAERLERNLDVLARGPRNAEPRQASLRAAIDWSHDLLTPAEQALFRRLSVFARGFTLEAAEVVCEGNGIARAEILDLLDGLVDKSLVTPTDRGDDEIRFVLLENIRAYAAKRLEAAGEGASVADRHAEYFGAVVDECAKARYDARTLRRLDHESPNILAATKHLAAGGNTRRHGRLVANLVVFWDLRGLRGVARRELHGYLARPDRERDLEADCLCGLGGVASTLGEYEEAVTRYQRAREIARELGDRDLECRCCGDLGNVASARGEHTEARRQWLEAATIASEIGSRQKEAQWRGALGLAAHNLGEYDLARSCFDASLALARDLDDRRMEGVWTGSLGNVEISLGNFAAARTNYEQALTMAREIGDRRFEGHWMGALADLAANMGDFERAQLLNQQSLLINRELGDRRLEGYRVANTGEVLAQLGRYEDAREHLDSALQIAQELGDRSLEGQCHGALGQLALTAGDPGSAQLMFEQALHVAQELGERRLEGQWLCKLGETAYELGDVGAARHQCLLSLEIAIEIGNPDAHLFGQCARLLSGLGQHRVAAQLVGAIDSLMLASGRSPEAAAQALADSVVAAAWGTLGETEAAAARNVGAGVEWQAAAESARGPLAE